MKKIKKTYYCIYYLMTLIICIHHLETNASVITRWPANRSECNAFLESLGDNSFVEDLTQFEKDYLRSFYNQMSNFDGARPMPGGGTGPDLSAVRIKLSHSPEKILLIELDVSAVNNQALRDSLITYVWDNYQVVNNFIFNHMNHPYIDNKVEFYSNIPSLAVLTTRPGW